MMHPIPVKLRQICIGLTVSFTTGLVLLGLPTGAIAQLNQSDITGINSMDPMGLNVLDSDPNRLDPGTLATAAELAAALDQAYAACLASRAAIADRPRRFARVPDGGVESCTTAECDRFNALRQQAQAFLNQARSQMSTQPRLDRRRW